VHHGDLELAQRLIRAGAKVNVKNDYGSTPMAEAAILGRADLLETLLKAGADVESPNADGQTSLMVVARTGRFDAARLLLKYGAKVNAVERWRGQTALMWASAQKQPAMVEVLIAAGATSTRDRRSTTGSARSLQSRARSIARPGASRHSSMPRAKAASNVRAFSSTPAPRSISPTPRRSVRC
jgi:ankyrin repeat protein